jgi:hypothetical protein
MIRRPRIQLFQQIVLLGTLLVAASCSKKSPEAVVPSPETPAQATATPNAPNAPPPQPQPYSPVTQAVAPSAEPNLAQINHAYIGWIMQTQRHAKTVEEFVAASGIQLPPAPAGKKYIIDSHGYIALVSQ